MYVFFTTAVQCGLQLVFPPPSVTLTRPSSPSTNKSASFTLKGEREGVMRATVLMSESDTDGGVRENNEEMSDEVGSKWRCGKKVME